MKALISFPGCAGAFPLFLGVAKRLRELQVQYPEIEYHYAGVSGGSIAAISLALGIDERTVFAGRDFFSSQFSVWWANSFTHFYKAAHAMLLEFIPENAYQDLSGRLHISVTRVGLGGIRREVISNFTSNADIAETIMTSVHLPFYGHGPVRRFRSGWALDGGVLGKMITMPDMVNVAFPISDFGIKLGDFRLSHKLDKWMRLYELGYNTAAAREDQIKLLLQTAADAALLARQRQTLPRSVA